MLQKGKTSHLKNKISLKKIGEFALTSIAKQIKKAKHKKEILTLTSTVFPPCSICLSRYSEDSRSLEEKEKRTISLVHVFLHSLSASTD